MGLKNVIFYEKRNWACAEGSSKKCSYTQAKSVVHKELRLMQDRWFSNKAKEIQGYADSGNMKQFYSSLSAVYGPQSSGSVPVLSSDGKTLLTEKEKILERWAEHFDGVLNRQSTINDWSTFRGRGQQGYLHSCENLPGR